MLVWATEFPAAPGKSAVDILPVAKEWLIGSPHSDWREGDFGEEPNGELTRYTASGETVTVAKVELDGQRWAGLQHAWTENEEREWTTEIVAHEIEGMVWISVRLDCNLLLGGIQMPTPNKPYILKLLLERLGGGFDSMLPISDKPVFLKEDEIDLATNLISGRERNRLPVVYTSIERGRRYSVNPHALARSLAGMAHVVTEPSRHFSFTLSRHVYGSNPYNGAIGIYWPNGAGQQARFLPGEYDSSAKLQNGIVEAVRVALTYIRPQSEATWSYMREVISRGRIERLRATASTELQEFISWFDAEDEAKSELLQTAEREIGRLRAEIARFEASGERSSKGILSPGAEQEFYPGEIRDAIIQTLRAGRGSLAPNSRWLHIVDDLLEANPIGNNRVNIATALKECLSKMSKFGTAERKVLEDIGFSVSESGKHAKAVYHEDDRYVFSISKTPSDTRSGKNLVSDITKTIFGAGN